MKIKQFKFRFKFDKIYFIPTKTTFQKWYTMLQNKKNHLKLMIDVDNIILCYL